MAAKSEAPQSMYWEGEWVCADCGYIYDSDDCGGLFFEQQVTGAEPFVLAHPVCVTEKRAHGRGSAVFSTGSGAKEPEG